DMTAAARKTDFIEAAQLRDEIMSLTQRLESLKQ
ncbi:MAG: UvrB/UvrC motif-containing protein, partial [Muribaculaceae bacterium]|nr:UvrB/UvrC motif-containing protein [Muribaculaceae bacterium]